MVEGIDNASIARTVCGTLQWAARQAQNPLLGTIGTDGGNVITATVHLPGEPKVRMTVEVEDGTTMRDKLVKVAESFHDLTALQAKQRDTAALMVRACLQRLCSPDSRKRREGIEGLEGLAALLEGKSNG